MAKARQSPTPSGATHLTPQPGERLGHRYGEEQADANGREEMLNDRFNIELATETRDVDDPEPVTGRGGGDDPISEGVAVESDLEEKPHD